MFNTRTFFGTDGTLTVANADSAMDAETLTSYLGQGNVVGRVVNVSLSVATDVQAFHEMGWRLPRELRAGRIAIGGTIERAYVNGALLRLMLGQYATAEEATGFTIPHFDLVVALDNQTPPGDPGNSSLTVYGVIFDRWRLDLPASDFTLENVGFKAQRIGVADTEVPA
jgi:hypothetical protein